MPPYRSAACAPCCLLAALRRRAKAPADKSCLRACPVHQLRCPRLQVLDQLQPSTLRVLRLVCRGWETAASRLLVHLRPEGIAGKQLGHRFPSLHSLDLSNCCMGVDFTTPRMLRLQVRGQGVWRGYPPGLAAWALVVVGAALVTHARLPRSAATSHLSPSPNQHSLLCYPYPQSLLCNEHLGELAGLSRLEQLSLRGCSRLTGAGLAQLGCLRRSLTMLNLSNCTGLTGGRECGSWATQD